MSGFPSGDLGAVRAPNGMLMGRWWPVRHTEGGPIPHVLLGNCVSEEAEAEDSGTRRRRRRKMRRRRRSYSVMIVVVQKEELVNRMTISCAICNLKTSSFCGKTFFSGRRGNGEGGGGSDVVQVEMVVQWRWWCSLVRISTNSNPQTDRWRREDSGVKTWSGGWDTGTCL